MAGVRKSMPEMQKFSTFRVLFLAILYFKAGKEARCSFFILQRALLLIKARQAASVYVICSPSTENMTKSVR